MVRRQGHSSHARVVRSYGTRFFFSSLRLGGLDDADCRLFLQVVSSFIAASGDLLAWLNGIENTSKNPGQSSAGYVWMMVRLTFPSFPLSAFCR